MSERYPVHAVEARWRQRWEASNLYRSDLDGADRPFYNMLEFPYPSGEGLHVGHVYTYCGADVFGRLRRMQGYDVFQPIGFDAFGIHSENFALKLGKHPAEVVPANIRRFREEQMKLLGCQFDWSRQVDTTSPEYYRWTQWIFVQLFKAGLAYQAEAPVNWCPRDQTVLANEQVIDGLCERCDTPIQQRVMRQWFFRITDYAERLLDFSRVDFPEQSIKRQTAWIGRSEGVEIDFAVVDRETSITVFTTRPDTIYGATVLVLAPEHPLVPAISSDEQRAAVAAYIAQAQRKLERDRLIGERKTGVWTGAYATNPATGTPIPIWIADYVLARYGSGAIMAVPAHDDRDHEFASAYGLLIATVLRPVAGAALRQKGRDRAARLGAIHAAERLRPVQRHG
jgi:leucyl-tRNA synthetase